MLFIPLPRPSHPGPRPKIETSILDNNADSPAGGWDHRRRFASALKCVGCVAERPESLNQTRPDERFPQTGAENVGKSPEKMKADWQEVCVNHSQVGEAKQVARPLRKMSGAKRKALFCASFNV